jgi:2-polyprenyl-6-methoxyphenol hydroxylase-like FAD-dependent oxidoreductase
VLERAPEFGEVGAGLGFTRNGMVALQALGVAEAVRAAGHLAPHGGYQDPTGRWLLRIPGGSPNREKLVAGQRDRPRGSPAVDGWRLPASG